MVRRAQAALRSVEHTSVRQLRVLAAIVFLFAMVIATVAPAVTAPMAFADSSTSSSSSSSSSSVDYATWAEVSKAMDKQLNSGLKTYKDGNTAGATSDFMGAYNKIYVASNFTAVVHDTIGADKQLAQQQAFQSVQNLSYTPSNDDQLAPISPSRRRTPKRCRRSWPKSARSSTPRKRRTRARAIVHGPTWPTK